MGKFIRVTHKGDKDVYLPLENMLNNLKFIGGDHDGSEICFLDNRMIEVKETPDQIMSKIEQAERS